ncbi:MAG: ISKra4 family transposase [Acidobacteria bacterium]|nr:MAG: ISKra4 family transposase [Acidobacteriota bacterium]
MNQPLRDLELRREELFRQIENLGDFRRGIISVNYRKCGKSNCACARKGHPGHGPQYLWNVSVGGKTQARNLPLGPELEKVQQEVERYQSFVRLSQELIAVNDQICQLRPARTIKDENELEQLKKKPAEEFRRETEKEIDRLMGQVLQDRERLGHLDLEASEMAIRTAMHQMGGVLLEKLLNSDGGGYRGAHLDCSQGHAAEFVGYRDKEILTVVSSVEARRAYYHCQECQSGFAPKDKELDVVGSSFSPGVRRMMARVGAKESFEQGRGDLEALAGVVVRTKQVERISVQLGQQVEAFCQREREAIVSGKVTPLVPPVPILYIAIDGTGVPVVPRETEGRRGKDARGKAKTREAKIGCLFTQTKQDDEGYPLRDENSTTYVGAIETAETFGWRIYAEAVRRGLRQAARVVVLGDGGPWIWGIAALHFPGTIEIVDLYHAREHLANLGKCIYGPTCREAKQWAAARSEQLDQGDVEAVITSMKRLRPRQEHVQKEVRKAMDYFQTNKERMRYAQFRSQGLFVGSGVVEAGCKTIIGQRLKQSGMRWTVNHANAIIALRCSQLSGRWEEFWEQRAAG